ncbi:hypothetical protein ABZU76_38675 [Amycolatopsis sp. NPDC005232]|uniref:hypothetical protein n=1 Tax=Amycolatopsis sp. NPDC005232 TaxID=3157027 RepID=UPI0033B971C4
MYDQETGEVLPGESADLFTAYGLPAAGTAGTRLQCRVTYVLGDDGVDHTDAYFVGTY